MNRMTKDVDLMPALYKTTVVIWSRFDAAKVELSELALDAESGTSFCSKSHTVMVREPVTDADFDENAASFFGSDDGD